MTVAVARIGRDGSLPAMPNIYHPDFDEPREHQGYRCLRAGLSRQAGSQSLGLSLWEVAPGEAAYPYHFHLAEEELVVVLDGRPTLRTPEGWRKLEPGEVVPFLVGEGGAHHIVNRTDETVRFLAFSPSGSPDVVIRPDSGTLGAYERRLDGGGLREVYRRSDAVDYYEGESR